MAKRVTKLSKVELAKLEIDNAERDLYIALLGMAPEDRSSRDSRYVCTTGELRGYAVKAGLIPAKILEMTGKARLAMLCDAAARVDESPGL